ncbi:hypothetical protein [Streptomyces sp. ODS05-4]|uniref:hypothetical protein n=1 Tax=Streptomyces sp. ODS05-4 TaxID=2944939 RepID=UPI00210CAC8B|nr:hypothetical protein [Streptomyces sp. ODS05-4]
MRATLIRRTALAASAVSLTLLATACGGGSSDGGDDKGAKDKGGSSAPAADKALTAADLEKVIVAQGDVKGHKVEKVSPELEQQGKATVTKNECQAITDVMSLKPVGEPAGTAKRQVTGEPKKPSVSASTAPEDMEDAMAQALNVNSTVVTLASYEGKGAEEALAALKTAGTACAAGFGATADGEDVKVTKITETPVAGGDEAAGWTVVVNMEGKDIPFYQLAAVRKGSTLATFGGMNLAAMAGKDVKPEPPTAVIEAQVAKLG